MLAGAAMMKFEGGLYPFFNDAFMAAEAVIYAEERSDDISMRFTGAKPASPFDRSMAPARDDETGVTRYEESLSYDGLTLYATGRGKPLVNLVDMDGKLVHQWTVPIDQLFAANPQRGKYNEKKLHATPRLFPNGDILIVISVRGTTPWGYGLAKLDKASNLLWAFAEPVHHDQDIGPDGTIYTLGHFIEAQPRPGMDRIETPFLDDTIIILSEAGEKLREFSILNAIRDSKYQSVLRYADPLSYNGDLLHANSIQFITSDLAENFPGVEAGNLLISLRNLDTIAVIDPEKEHVVWAVRGGWHMQHDPDLLANGNILVFDNLGDVGNIGGSRVIEFDPLTLEHTWVFPGDSGEILFSAVKSSQQRLPNGNTLITETNNGRILEVTQDHSVAWEFYIPERVRRESGIYTKVVDAQRFPPEYVEFEFNMH
jgi:hypothetical protein